MNKSPNMNGLKPFNSITGKEQGKKGGIVSGESKRQRKLLRDCLQSLLDDEITIDDVTLTGSEHLAIRLFNIALNSNNEYAIIKAFTTIRDTVGEKPVEKIEMNNIDQSVIDEIEELILEIENEEC